MLLKFEVLGRKLPLYKRAGESFEHVMLKALGYGLFAEKYEGLEIERRLGGRYTPDVVAVGDDGRVLFWGECGSVSIRKAAWLAKHSGAGELAFFKLALAAGFVAELRDAIDARYRSPGRIGVYSFAAGTRERVEALALRLETIPADWYRRTEV